MYRDDFKARGVKFIRHFTTPVMRYPTDEEKASLTVIAQLWKTGDRFYKLAGEHYGDPRYWWIIAWYNKRPTEAHFKPGDSVYIPLPLHEIIEFLGL